MYKLNWITKACGVFLLWAMAAVALPAQTFTSLYSFCPGGGICADGAYPEGAPVQATDGNLYGTTELGGHQQQLWPRLRRGFKITPSGAFTTLFSFDLTDGGGDPLGPLVQGTDGELYGTTGDGGANDLARSSKLPQVARLTTLHSFDGTDGQIPSAGLVQATNGNFYGTTQRWRDGAGSDGTVFKITPSGTLTALYSFCSQTNCTDGAYPSRGWSRPRWELLRDNRSWGTGLMSTAGRLWHGLQNHPKWHADHAAQLPTLRTALTRTAAGPGHRWKLLRDNDRRRGQR